MKDRERTRAGNSVGIFNSPIEEVEKIRRGRLTEGDLSNPKEKAELSASITSITPPQSPDVAQSNPYINTELGPRSDELRIMPDAEKKDHVKLQVYVRESDKKYFDRLIFEMKQNHYSTATLSSFIRSVSTFFQDTNLHVSGCVDQEDTVRHLKEYYPVRK